MGVACLLLELLALLLRPELLRGLGGLCGLGGLGGPLVHLCLHSARTHGAHVTLMGMGRGMGMGRR